MDEPKMNRDSIIRMAQEACDTDKVDAWHNGFWTLTQEEIERFAALVAAAEREACAKVCDVNKHYFGYQCAEAIRRRSEIDSIVQNERSARGQNDGH